MRELAVTAIGADRPGIVAAVAEVLRDRGGNLEDSAMTVLGGQFAIVLLVAADDEPDELQAALVGATAALHLTVNVTEVEAHHTSPAPSHVLSVYGSDRPGLLAAVTRLLADLDVNVTDVDTRLLSPEDEPVYAMVLELTLPAGLEAEALDARLAELDPELGLDHTLRPLDTETY